MYSSWTCFSGPEALASATLCRGKFTEGESCASTSAVSVDPICLIWSDPKTSTGTASSSAAVCRALEPITTSARETAVWRTTKSCWTTWSAATTRLVVGAT